MMFLAYRYVCYIKNLNITEAFNLIIMISSVESEGTETQEDHAEDN